MKALFVLVNPIDRPRFDEDLLWDQMSNALDASGSGAFVRERLGDPTEPSLRQVLVREGWDVLHLITHAEARETTAYGTIALKSSEGRSRYISARHFLTLFSQGPQPRLIVLQSLGDEAQRFVSFARTVADNGIRAVLCAPPLRGATGSRFVTELYKRLAAGASLRELEGSFADASNQLERGPNGQAVCLGQDRTSPIVIPSQTALSRPMEVLLSPSDVRSEDGATDSHGRTLRSEDGTGPEPWRSRLIEQRGGPVFDAFLSHNSEDKAHVKQLALDLLKAGILPWLDVWELQPGQLWQPALYEQIHTIKAAVVCIGAFGVRNWQEQEINTFFIEFVDRKAPVIPALLPNAPDNPAIPNFLRNMSWVDFRRSDPPPLEHLIWGITGKRPGDQSWGSKDLRSGQNTRRG